jgi:hypothetical protein
MISAKTYSNPRFTSWLDSEDLEGISRDHGRISDEGLSNVDFSRTSIAQENSASNSTTYLN